MKKTNTYTYTYTHIHTYILGNKNYRRKHTSGKTNQTCTESHMQFKKSSSHMHAYTYIHTYVHAFTSSAALRNSKKKEFVGCFSDENGGNCQSGETYQQGFKQAREKLNCPIGLWENVTDALKRMKDQQGLPQDPEINTVIADMKEQGCAFGYAAVDFCRYLLPQRRNRVYGAASKGGGQYTSTEFPRVMQLMESIQRRVHTYIHT